MARPRTTKQRYDIVMGAINESVYDWDLVRNRFWTSESMHRLLGLAPERLTLDGWRKTIHPDDYARFRDATVAHLKGETERFECDYRFRSGDGTWHWARTHGLAVRDKRGRALRMVGSTGDITELKRAEEAVKEALAEQTATAEILKVTTGSPTDVQPVFEAILANALRLCEASFAAVFTFDGELIRNVAHLNASSEFARFLGSGGVRPSRETTTRRCALERRTIHTPDLMNDPEFSPPEAQRREKVRTSLSVPMFRESALVGVISLWRPEVRPFTDKQIALVETFADQAAIAIENVRLFNETREALEQQKAIAEVLGVVTQLQTDVQPVFQAIGRNAARLCGALFSCVYRFDGELIHLVATHNLPPSAMALGRTLYPMRPDRSQLSGRAVLTRSVQRLEDAAQDADYAMHVAVAGGWRRLLAVPMLREAEPLGVIAVGWRDPGPIPEPRVELLKTFADQAVIAIEKVRLFNETREALDQQTATAEILSVISRSPTDTQPVFDAIVQSGLKLFSDAAISIALPDGGQIRAAAVAESDAARAAAWRSRFPFPLNREYMHGVAILDRRMVDLPDVRDAPPHMAAGSRNFLASGYRAITIMPMMHGEQAIGALSVVRMAPGPLSAKQLAVLKTFADQAVIAIENVRLFNETKEALEQQKAAGEVLQVISSSIADTGPVFDKILESCERLFAGRIVGLNLVHEDGMLHIGAYHGEHRQQFERIFPIPVTRDSGSGLAIVERRVVHYPDTENGADVPARTRQGCRAIGIKSAIFAPLLWEGHGVGAIFVGRDRVSSFSEKEIALLRTFADQAAIAIENVRLFKETKEALEQQKAAADILRVISGSIADTAPVFDKIIESCEHLFAGRIVGLNLVGEDGLVRNVAYHGPRREEFQRRFPTPANRETGTVRAILEQRVLHYPDVEHGEDVPGGTRGGCAVLGIKSVVFAPLLWEGQGLGAIWVGRDHVSSFSEKEMALLRTFADQAVIAIQNARLFREIQEKSRQLEIASRHKSEFLANMSHELRTPLNAIIGFTRIVMRRSQEALEPKQYENLEKILASGQNLLALINSVLDLSKVEAGRVEVRPGEVELAPLLDQCLRTIEPLVRVALVKELDEGLPRMYTDEEKLRQIVINLLSNAAKFTEHGTIRLRAQAANGSVSITVADTGIGIAADKLGLVFEEFEQADPSSTRLHGGTGLGLTIARRLARLMGGDIGVESTLGTGSRFTLTLPLRYPA